MLLECSQQNAVDSGWCVHRLILAAIYLGKIPKNNNKSNIWPEVSQFNSNTTTFNWASKFHMEHLWSLRRQWATDSVQMNTELQLLSVLQLLHLWAYCGVCSDFLFNVLNPRRNA
jgi:hypothetical protein